jgi:hypothetical protein
MDQTAPETVLPEPSAPTPATRPTPVASPVEQGGRRSNVSKGLEPTRFGDWEKDGRCIDF